MGEEKFKSVKESQIDSGNTAFNTDMKAVGDMLGVKDNEVLSKKTKLSRSEKKKIKRELKARMAGINREIKKNKMEQKRISNEKKAVNKNINQKLKERDKAISDKTKTNRKKRLRANNLCQFIGYKHMFKNGICEVDDGVFSQTLEFSDISYQSAREDHQTAVFDTMGDIYNYLEPGVSVQFNVINSKIPEDEIGKRKFFDITAQQTDIAKEDAVIFNSILNNKMLEGISNLKRRRLITYAVSAEDLNAALPKLARIRTDLVGKFNQINCEVKVLDGYERLVILKEELTPGKPLIFDYDKSISLASGLTTKDFIVPSAIDFKPDGDNSSFVSDNLHHQVLVFTKFGSDLNDRVISDIVDLPYPMNVAWYSQAIDRAEAINYVRTRAGWIDKEITDEQKHAVKKGLLTGVLPPQLLYNKDEVADLLDQMLNKNQNLFSFTGIVHLYAKTKEELDNQVLQIISIGRTKSVTIDTLNFRQREGINSCLPLGNNYLNISRKFTTAQMSIFMPFATQEIFDENGSYYGQNKNSNNLVIANRKKLASPVGFICGKTGSGKSFFTKQEIENTILNSPNDQIIIFDRAGEYTMLTEHHKGTVFKFGVNSETYLNPFDIGQDVEQTWEQQIVNKVDAIIAQSSAAAEDSGFGLSEEDRSIISRCVELAFKEARETRQGVPLLGDFKRILEEQPEQIARDIALKYERFVEGSQSFFNKHSNVDWNSRIIDINIKELPENMLIFCLITMCEAARNQMYRNFEKNKRTWIYIEEIQSLFKYPAVLEYFSRFSKEARKFGGLLTGITQNSVSMLENEDSKPIILNADFIVLLKQSPVDRAAWADMLSLSDQEVSFIDESADRGAGLLCAGPNKVPIVGGFPKGNKLYDLFSTDPNEIEENKRMEKFNRGVVESI